MTLQFDAIVIGTGQTGPPLTARLSKEGLKTAVIERKFFGGTCVNVGGTPTKAMVASARADYMIAPYGGIRPRPRPRSPLALTLLEREEISRGIAAGESMRSIDRGLNLAASTVSQVIRRNGAGSAYRTVARCRSSRKCHSGVWWCEGDFTTEERGIETNAIF